MYKDLICLQISVQPEDWSQTDHRRRPIPKLRLLNSPLGTSDALVLDHHRPPLDGGPLGVGRLGTVLLVQRGVDHFGARLDTSPILTQDNYSSQ